MFRLRQLTSLSLTRAANLKSGLNSSFGLYDALSSRFLSRSSTHEFARPHHDHSHTPSTSQTHSHMDSKIKESSTSHGHGHGHPTESSRLKPSDIRRMQGFIIDMDGVIYHQNKVLPGALDFIQWLQQNKKKFLFLTNSSERSPKELSIKLERLGIQVEPERFYTSALATASFLKSQKPNGTAFVIGEPGLMSALYDAGYSMNDINPDYVIVGETKNINYAMMEKAVALVLKGSRLIGTNCDVADRSHDAFIPACGALIKPIELAAGRQAYFIGKPNPIIMRHALQQLAVAADQTAIIGDRMDTDILSGLQSELTTCLLLSGVTRLSDIATFAYRPDCVCRGIGNILKDEEIAVPAPAPLLSSED